MISNKDMPAMPIELSGFGQCQPEAYIGLTKREMFAMHAMSNLKLGDYMNAADMANDAVLMADALLEELSKEK